MVHPCCSMCQNVPPPFLRLNNITLYVFLTFSIHSSVDEHVNCLAILKNTALNLGVQIPQVLTCILLYFKFFLHLGNCISNQLLYNTPKTGWFNNNDLLFLLVLWVGWVVLQFVYLASVTWWNSDGRSGGHKGPNWLLSHVLQLVLASPVWFSSI